MDTFISLAKQGYEAYSQSQQSESQQPSQPNVHRTGGQEYNSPHHSGQSGQPQQWNYGDHGINHDDIVGNADDQHGPGHGEAFKNAMSYVQDNQHATHQEPVDEQHVVDAHRQVYQNNNASSMSANSLGGAAAMQILQKFTSGGLGGGSGGGGSKTQLVSMAMAEASKLFDKSGGAASGTKQDAINGAAMTVMKLLVQSKLGGSGITGGGDSGGLSGLMGLATKFI